ncbi:Thiol-disulfide isomerase or thioredoxin [Mariprofundus ferrinatatus]|uniref:Thiol-disulfide isomerase or thioredoxin n=1 Tax=Mariprofundus ferrinatatus TaxID=1921087 RepID=A0A2K8L4P2_9PROT|nr:thioredoxin family protein [Mariprofundus ferrinatatus]ATX82295.1 Thiol-disulfide isomerase or thioredoxin [Mariprofundus ferrinatatus]
MNRMLKALCLLVLLLPAPLLYGQEGSPPIDRSAAGKADVVLYFFWSDACPHCLEAKPVVEKLAASHPWLALQSMNLRGNPAHQQRYQQMAAPFGEKKGAVPAFFFCGEMVVGFDREATTGTYLRDKLSACHSALAAGRAPEQQQMATTATDIELEGMSLPVITLMLAGLDAFNPCAFFVLLLLLSLLVHARNQRLMLLIGTVFVFFSGLIYFLFMAAWLNIFLLFGQMRWITLTAGLIAIAMALFNIKDYLFAGAGPSLSISDAAKPALFERMRRLIQARSLAATLLGTIVLAIAANSYELLCTSGLPLIYTRTLTLAELPTSTYYLYLVAYNVIYVLPLLLIVLLFVRTMGSRKLQPREGRLLKLLSGLMMLGLGLLLTLAPEYLSRVSVAIGTILTAVAITLLAAVAERRRKNNAA